MHSITLQWKEFNINLAMVEADLKTLFPKITGSSADYVFTLWCNEELTEQERLDIQAYWDAITVDSLEATSYKTSAQIQQEQLEAQQALKASARAKLSALGLSEAEITAIIGG